MSETLNVLKTVKERLGHNYTSHQLLTVLDNLIWKAVSPIVNTSDYLDRIIASVISWSATNPRRKVSSLPKPRFNTYATAFIIANDAKTKMRILKKMRLERNILLYTIDRWTTIGATCCAQLPDQRITRALSVYDGKRFWFGVRESKFWYDHALEFKGMIMEKYMRLVMMETQLFHKQQKENNPHLKFDIEDVAQNFMLAVNRSIDKCDAKQGTLTSYVKNWIKDAKSNPNLRGEYGIAYTIPASQRRAMVRDPKSTAVNISISIDDEALLGLTSDSDIEAETMRKDTIHRIRLLAKRADPRGLGRMALGIEEFLSSHELSIQSNQLTQTVGASQWQQEQNSRAIKVTAI